MIRVAHLLIINRVVLYKGYVCDCKIYLLKIVLFMKNTTHWLFGGLKHDLKLYR